ncbi:hypothetical protein EZS27_004467 [termite gut metagenome]|uniref:Uncharacterized protein n=1 Tax=termite gut metagenome TaxID=433724 RepID=A0A5J4SQC8_9ZZZZ
MKQAILITAYKNLDFISNIIEHFDEYFDFYIHIDKKCKEDSSIFDKYNQVYVFKQYRIQWGGLNHCKAIFLLMSKAFEKRYGFYHLITGSDYPIKSLNEFKTFFEKY